MFNSDVFSIWTINTFSQNRLNFALCGFHLAVNHGIQYISMFCVVQICF